MNNLKQIVLPSGSSSLSFAKTSVASLHVTASSVQIQDSSSKGELVQLVEKSQGSKRFP